MDLLRFLVDNPIVSHSMIEMDSYTRDTSSIRLCFADGSIGTVHYFANGHASFPKERLEVFAGGAVLQLDNFRTMKGFGWNGFKKMKLWSQDKGHKACAAAFINALKPQCVGPIKLNEILEISKICLDLSNKYNQ